MRLLKNLMALAALALAAPAIAQAPATLGPAPAVPALIGHKTPAAPAALPSQPNAVPPLTAQDVTAWLDGFMPYALQRGNIAGAVVVVVKDGQPLLEKGYGVSDVKTRKPVDPQSTLFRPGSVSKLFTWTAVMQLVQAGKIDLDADVNTYLDFKIPPAFGKPVTMRELMTHSAGFSDAAKDLITSDPKKNRPLGRALLVKWMPARIFPPGTTPAYSNFGAAVAGYIVQRLSGEPFAQYVANHILTPLGMTSSTFIEPLPAGWGANMSKGYQVASGPAHPFEYISGSPAGALSATGADMGKFMIAQLADGAYPGGAILDPKTAQLMHSPQFRPVPNLPAMDLGFYQEDANGHRVIGHAGDTAWFHSDLHLFLDDHVGVFISMNSLGAQGAAEFVRASLLRGFADRYFPAAPENLPTWKDAARDGRTLAGTYIFSRRSDTGWLRLFAMIAPYTIASDKAGILTVSVFRGVDGQPKHWREVGPFLWREVGGASVMSAVVRGGKVVFVASDDLPPVMALTPAPAWAAAWNKPLFIATIVVLALTVIFWPVIAVVRWRYRTAFPLAGRAALLHRLTRLVCLIDLLFFCSLLALVVAGTSNLELLSSENDWMFRVIQLIGLVGVIGTLAVLANAAVVLGDRTRSWWAKLVSVVIAAACVAVVWFAFADHLLTLRLAY